MAIGQPRAVRVQCPKGNLCALRRCGAKLDGKYPSHEIWEKFGTEVGWRVNNSWQNYHFHTWGICVSEVPIGHLPWGGVVVVGGGWWGGGVGEVLNLFSRIKTCEV